MKRFLLVFTSLCLLACFMVVPVLAAENDENTADVPISLRSYPEKEYPTWSVFNAMCDAIPLFEGSYNFNSYVIFHDYGNTYEDGTQQIRLWAWDDAETTVKITIPDTDFEYVYIYDAENTVNGKRLYTYVWNFETSTWDYSFYSTNSKRNILEQSLIYSSVDIPYGDAFFTQGALNGIKLPLWSARSSDIVPMKVEIRKTILTIVPFGVGLIALLIGLPLFGKVLFRFLGR